MSPSRRYGLCALTFCLLLACWSVKESWLTPLLTLTQPAAALPWLNAVIKCALWLLPAILLLRHYAPQVARPLPVLFGGPQPPYTVALGLGALLLLRTAIHALLARSAFTPAPFLEWVSPVLVAGITEEAVFRGWLLGILEPAAGATRANALQALLFTLIHFPKWLSEGVTPLGLLQSCAFIAAFGFLLGHVTVRNRSLWPAIGLHMLNNALTLLL